MTLSLLLTHLQHISTTPLSFVSPFQACHAGVPTNVRPRSHIFADRFTPLGPAFCFVCFSNTPHGTCGSLAFSVQTGILQPGVAVLIPLDHLIISGEPMPWPVMASNPSGVDGFTRPHIVYEPHDQRVDPSSVLVYFLIRVLTTIYYPHPSGCALDTRPLQAQDARRIESARTVPAILDSSDTFAPGHSMA